MIQLLKSIGFGIACTTVIAIAACGLIAVVWYFERLGSGYALIPLAALICIVCSTAHYFRNK